MMSDATIRGVIRGEITGKEVDACIIWRRLNDTVDSSYDAFHIEWLVAETNSGLVETTKGLEDSTLHWKGLEVVYYNYYSPMDWNNWFASVFENMGYLWSAFDPLAFLPLTGSAHLCGYTSFYGVLNQ